MKESNYTMAIGIDMALTHTGWALMRINLERIEEPPVLVEYGVIESPCDHIREKNGLARLEAILDRSQKFYWEMYHLCESKNALCAAIETPFGSKNAAASMAMGTVFGCIACLKMMLPYMNVQIVHPSDSKEMVQNSIKGIKKVGRGKISKTLVRHWVFNIHKEEIGLDAPDHVYDAVAAFWVWWTGTKAKLCYQHTKKGSSPKSDDIKEGDVIDVEISS